MDIEKIYMDEKKALFDKHIIYDGCMWCFLSMSDDFVKIDMQSWNMSYIRMRSKDGEKILFCPNCGTDGLTCEKDVIYRVDFNAQGIYKYNLTEKIYEYIKFDFQLKRGENFAAVFARNENIYFFMVNNGVVYKLDIAMEKIVRINKISQLLKCDILFSNGIQVDNEVWLFSDKSAQVITYNMDTDECHLYNLPRSVNGCRDMMFFERVFWILDIDYRILKWNPLTDELQAWWKIDTVIDENYFAKIVVTEKIVYLLPALGKDILIINKQSMETSKLDVYPKDFKYLAYDNWSKYLGYSDDKMIRYFSMRSANYILSINLITGQLKWIRPTRPAEIENLLYDSEMHANKVIMEKKEFLKQYISLVTKQMEKIQISDKTKGKDIYNTCSLV